MVGLCLLWNIALTDCISMIAAAGTVLGPFFKFYFYFYGLILEREDLDTRRTGVAFFLCPGPAEL